MKLIKRRNFKEKQRVDESLSLLYQSPLKLELKQNCSREGEREREREREFERQGSEGKVFIYFKLRPKTDSSGVQNGPSWAGLGLPRVSPFLRLSNPIVSNRARGKRVLEVEEGNIFFFIQFLLNCNLHF